MVATKQHLYPTAELDRVQQFLLGRASKRNRKLVMTQSEMATAIGMEKTRFHRIIAQMVDEGRLKVISVHPRSTTVVVEEIS